VIEQQSWKIDVATQRQSSGQSSTELTVYR